MALFVRVTVACVTVPRGEYAVPAGADARLLPRLAVHPAAPVSAGHRVHPARDGANERLLRQPHLRPGLPLAVSLCRHCLQPLLFHLPRQGQPY
jgi:hypothetical protein